MSDFTHSVSDALSRIVDEPPLAAGIVTRPPGKAMRVWKEVVPGVSQMLWVLRGSITVDRAAGPVVARAGSLMWLPTPVLELVKWDRAERTRCAFVRFKLGAGAAAIGDVNLWPRVRAMPQGDLVRPLFRHLLRYAADDKATAVDTLSLLLRLYVSGRTVGLLAPTPVYPEALEKALAFLRQELTERCCRRPTTAQIAAACDRSEPTVQRMFRAHLGMSPQRAYRLAQLDRAVDLLRTTNETTHAIAAMTGFCDHAHLGVHTRKHFKKTPKALRRAFWWGLLASVPRLSILQGSVTDGVAEMSETIDGLPDFMLNADATIDRRLIEELPFDPAWLKEVEIDNPLAEGPRAATRKKRKYRYRPTGQRHDGVSRSGINAPMEGVMDEM